MARSGAFRVQIEAQAQGSEPWVETVLSTCVSKVDSPTGCFSGYGLFKHLCLVTFRVPESYAKQSGQARGFRSQDLLSATQFWTLRHVLALQNELALLRYFSLVSSKITIQVLACSWGQPTLRPGCHPEPYFPWVVILRSLHLKAQYVTFTRIHTIQ